MSLKSVQELEEEHLLGTYNRYSILVDRGRGPYLVDRSHKRYLDLLSGIGVNILGHNHPRIVRLLRKQIKRPLHVSNLMYHEYAGRLAQRLCAISGLDKAFFTNSGAESVEGALKFARLFANSGRGGPRKRRVLALEGSFHGRTMGALSATHPVRYRDAFEPLVPGFDFVGFDDVEDLERRFSDDVAAVILEAVQGEGGVRPISDAFYRRARELTRAAGAALIADEIQCGLGRTGRWFGFERCLPPGSVYADRPDLIAIAKPLAGGIPMGAVLLKAAVADPIRAGIHGTTFGGGPLACRVALEVLKIVEEERLLDHARDVGSYFEQRLEELLVLPAATEVRGDGLMLALELGVAARPVVERLIAAGFIANSTRNTVLRFLPPLIIRKKQVDRFIAALRAELEKE